MSGHRVDLWSTLSNRKFGRCWPNSERLIKTIDITKPRAMQTQRPQRRRCRHHNIRRRCHERTDLRRGHCVIENKQYPFSGHCRTESLDAAIQQSSELLTRNPQPSQHRSRNISRSNRIRRRPTKIHINLTIGILIRAHMRPSAHYRRLPDATRTSQHNRPRGRPIRFITQSVERSHNIDPVGEERDSQRNLPRRFQLRPARQMDIHRRRCPNLEHGPPNRP